MARKKQPIKTVKTDGVENILTGLGRHGRDANTATTGDDAFVWKGMSAPEVAKAGNLWGEHFDATATSPERVRVYGDVNGDNVADFAIDVCSLSVLLFPCCFVYVSCFVSLFLFSCSFVGQQFKIVSCFVSCFDFLLCFLL
jgi:hypothetical protein